MKNWFVEKMPNEIGYDVIKSRKKEFHEWGYKAFDLKETGYESVEEELQSYKASEFSELCETGKKKVLDDVLAIYRRINLFPIIYYSEEGILEDIAKCIDFKKAKFEGNEVNCGAGVGTTLCRYLFPNIFDTPSKHDLDKKGAETMYKKFHNDKFLKRAIEFSFSYKGGSPVPSKVEGGLRLVGSAPSNFRPMNARAIYERFCPEGGTIYDFCAGFGGRLLGCLSSKKNFRYVATDPCVESMYHLHELGSYIEEVTGRTNSYELHCCGSEDFKGPANSIDFAFSSPPYFDLEVYSTDETQCFNKYPELDQWLEGYVRETIKNIKHMLKPNRKYAVNIADFKVGGKLVSYVDAWIRISKEEGMPLYDIVFLGVNARAGSKEQLAGETKKENILVFVKN